VPEEKIVEAHGSFREGYCTGCQQRCNLATLKHQIFHPDSEDGVPKCPSCQGNIPFTVIMASVTDLLVFFTDQDPQNENQEFLIWILL